MNSLTHKFITQLAFEQIEPPINKDILISSSVKPDEDETSGAFMWHFYNPATKKNYKGGRVSALTKLLEHFDSAIDSYRSDDDMNYANELGRACHFMQDMCTPVHTYYEDTFDAVTRLKQHTHFEKYCDNLIKNEDIQFITIDSGFKIMLSVNNLKTLAKYFNCIASKEFFELEYKKKDIKEIAINSINNGILATCAILLHFNHDKTRDGK